MFREFQNYVDRRDDRLEEIMKQLRDDARYFRESETVESGARDREALFHERRLAMDARAVLNRRLVCGYPVGVALGS